MRRTKIESERGNRREAIDLTKEQLLDLYRQMVLIRRFEEKAAEMYTHGKIGGFLHLYIGQEATGVGAIATLALKRFPQLNCYCLPEGIKQNEKINIGIAIAVEDGLVAPALLDCGKKGLLDIAAASKDLVERTKAGVLKAEEYAGATFTLTNLGMLSVDSFQAIINPPQTAILALGTVKAAPVVRGGEITVAEVMKASLSADHRVVDGVQGAQFMNEFKGFLEAPLKLLL